jgi:uncharacterized membrane protein YjjP (DUF1212 family)
MPESAPTVGALRTEAEAQAEALLVRVAGLLHSHGTPAHRLERLLGVMSRHFGVQAQFLSSPTSLIAAFGAGADQRVRMLRIEPGEVNLGKLIEFDELLERVEDGSLSIPAAHQQLDRLETQGPRHPVWLTLLAAGGACASAAAVFRGGAREVLAAGLIGCLLGVLELVLGRAREAARLFEPLGGFVAALSAATLGRFVAPVDVGLVTLSALIIAVPGLTLTVAMIELATRHLVSGSARFAGAITVFLTLTLGVALGRGVALGLGLDAPAELAGAGAKLGETRWLLPLSICAAPVAFAVLFQARWRELPWILGACWIGYFGAHFGRALLGPDLAPFLGATLVGLTANVYARVHDRPALVPSTPGILMLVPGSIGFRALDLLLARDTVSGVRTAFEMVLVATALVGGLLLANVILSPRRTL